MRIKQIPGNLCDQSTEIQEMVSELVRERNRQETPEAVWQKMKGFAEGLNNPVNEVLVQHLEMARAPKIARQSGQF